MAQRRRPERNEPVMHSAAKDALPSLGASGSERRREIVRLAGELFARDGYATTTVRDIADRAGILSGSLYWHFASKEDIVAELLADFLGHLMRRYREVLATAETPLDGLRGIVTVAIEAIGPYGTAANVLQSEKTWLYEQEQFAFVPAAAEEVRRIWSAVLRDCVADGSVRSDIDIELTFRFLRDGVWSVARWYGGDTRSLDEIAREFVRHNLTGIIAPSPRGRGDQAPAATRT